MVELRKRKTPPSAPAPPAKKKAAPKESKVSKAKAAVAEQVEAVKEAVIGTSEANGESAPPASAPKVGDTIDLSAFGAEVETHDGVKTSFAQILEQSKSGVVLFTYPKASTPGCTRQACHFRDSYTPLTATGFDIYGLSNDNPKSNTAFKTKQKLPYPLLCDTSRQLITAIGLKNAKNTTARGVFVVDKKGKVLAAETASPEASVEIVRKIINAGETTGATSSATEGTKETDVAVATTADEVANTAAKLDGDEV